MRFQTILSAAVLASSALALPATSKSTIGSPVPAVDNDDVLATRDLEGRSTMDSNTLALLAPAGLALAPSTKDTSTIGQAAPSASTDSLLDARDVNDNSTISDSLDARDVKVGTRISLDTTTWTARWSKGTRRAHDALWTKALELCTDSACNSDEKSWVSILGPSDDILTLRLEGQFDPSVKDDFFRLILAAMGKALTPIKLEGDGYYEGWETVTGPGWINVNHFNADGTSGSFLTAWMKHEKTDAGFGACDVIAAGITAAGSALVPELSPFFGLVGGFCKA